MESWYFETSVVNWLMSQITVYEAEKTKYFQRSKGRLWKLSPITLWEILMTSSDEHQDEITFFCQHLFDEELLPSPSELIISYIETGMPRVEAHRALRSNLHIANVWRELVTDKRKCFIYDKEDLRRKIKFIQNYI